MFKIFCTENNRVGKIYHTYIRQNLMSSILKLDNTTQCGAIQKRKWGMNEHIDMVKNT